MSTTFVAISERMTKSSQLVLQLTLGKHRVYQAPHESCRVRVLAGAAWVTFDDTDYIVWAGKSMDLEGSRYGALVSAVGGEELVIEVRSRQPISYDLFMRELARISQRRQPVLAELTRRSALW